MASLLKILTQFVLPEDPAEPVEPLLDSLVRPSFRLRVDGAVYERDQVAAHLTQARRRMVGGSFELIDEVATPSCLAARLLTHVLVPDGTAITLESHSFARVAADGRLENLAEVFRMVEEGDGKL